MKLDRQYQLELLKMLSESYPNSFDYRAFCKDMSDEETQSFMANLVYLGEHGLVDSGIQPGGSRSVMVRLPRITNKGMDFLADDGGLSAILGVVTVRFHADTIKALLLDKIETSDIPTEEKSRLKKHLEALSGEAWKEAGKYLMQQGLHHLPDAVGWLYKMISHAP